MSKFTDELRRPYPIPGDRNPSTFCVEAADLLDEAEKALLYARDEIGKHKPTSSGVDALNQVKRTLARIRGEKA